MGLSTDTPMITGRRDILLSSLFYLFLALLVGMRVLLFLDLNINFIDSDMPFFWAGIQDYAKGLFYEPRFYGQNYNTFMESLLAVPLYLCGMPVYYALPVVTHIVALFPFIFTACWLFYKGRKENALLVLAILLCLTPGYEVMTSLPRGISGVFFTGFYVLSLVYPRDLRFLVLNTFLSVLGYFLTPNIVIVSVPLMAYLFLHNYKDKRYYAATIGCLLTVIPFYFLFDKFYKDHPEYVVYGLNNSWSLECFLETICHLDRSFAHVTFLAEEHSFPLLIVMAVLAAALFKTDKKAFLAFLAFTGILLFSFFATKVREGVVWPFYSFSRMYIGIPIVLALFTVFFRIRRGIFLTCIVLLSLAYASFKFITFKSSVAYHTQEKRWNGVHLIPLSTVLDGCKAFKEVCAKQQSDYLLISSTFWLATYLNYGGQAIDKDFPDSQETFAERRYWIREKYRSIVYERFVLLSVNFDLDKALAANGHFKIKRLDDYGLFLIEQNTLAQQDFIPLVIQAEGS